MNSNQQAEAVQETAHCKKSLEQEKSALQSGLNQVKALVGAASTLLDLRPQAFLLLDGGFHSHCAKRPISLESQPTKPFGRDEWEKHRLTKEEIEVQCAAFIKHGHMFGLAKTATARLLCIDVDGLMPPDKKTPKPGFDKSKTIQFLVDLFGPTLAYKDSSSYPDTNAHLWWPVTDDCAKHFLSNPKECPASWEFDGTNMGEIRFVSGQMALHGDELIRIVNGLQHPHTTPLTLDQFKQGPWKTISKQNALPKQIAKPTIANNGNGKGIRQYTTAKLKELANQNWQELAALDGKNGSRHHAFFKLCLRNFQLAHSLYDEDYIVKQMVRAMSRCKPDEPNPERTARDAIKKAKESPEQLHYPLPDNPHQQQPTADIDQLCQEAQKHYTHASCPNEFFKIDQPNEYGNCNPRRIHRQQLATYYGSLPGIGDKGVKQILTSIAQRGIETLCHKPYQPSFTTDERNLPSLNTATDNLPKLGNPNNFLTSPFHNHCAIVFSKPERTYIYDLLRCAIQSIIQRQPDRKTPATYLGGQQGVGKDGFIELIAEMLGSTNTDVSQAMFSDGNFNKDLREYVTFLSDESIPNDKRFSIQGLHGRIKKHISARKMAIMAKYQDATQTRRYGLFFICLNQSDNNSWPLLINPLEPSLAGKFAMINMQPGPHMKMTDSQEVDHYFDTIKASLPDALAYFATTNIEGKKNFRFGVEPIVNAHMRQCAIDANGVTDLFIFIRALIKEVQKQSHRFPLNETKEFFILKLKDIKELFETTLASAFPNYKITTRKLKPEITKYKEQLGIKIQTKQWGGKQRTEFLFPTEHTEKLQQQDPNEDNQWGEFHTPETPAK